MSLKYHSSQDLLDRASGIEVAYINARVINNKIQCVWWYKPNDSRNKCKMLPGKPQTKNRGLLFALRELLKNIRQFNQTIYLDEQPALLIIKTDASYIDDGVSTYRFKWRQQNWTNKKGKKIKNSVFWQSVNNELTLLEKDKLDVKIERHSFKFSFF